jgi:isochorismate synthase EntC
MKSMIPKAFRRTAMARSAQKPVAKVVFARKAAIKPDERDAPAVGMAARLATLKAADFPWLSPDGLALLADAPEVSGPPTYKNPRDGQ